ncbi:MAG: hypothetical protein ACKVUS_08635 [Saprospiraceae bacterium]
MPIHIERDFKEFVELLNAHEARYLVVGGYAVNYHGYPRYTKDIDFWIWLSESNAERMLKVISDFGFSKMGFELEDFLNPGTIIQFGREPKRIDLILDLSGLDFEECYNRKEAIDLNGITVNFIGFYDLIEAKKRAGRLQDLADAGELTKLKEEQRKVEEGSAALPQLKKKRK